MTTTPPQPPTPQIPPAPSPKRDTTLGWLSHLLMLPTWFIGPLIIWQVKKDEDKFAAFHAKQAMCWALAVTAIVICLEIMMVILALLVGPLVIVTACFIWLAGLGNLVYVIFAIIHTAKDKPFKYFFVADQFCKREFAEAYPAPAGDEPTTS